MKRRLFTLVAAASMLLSIAVVALWVRSYGRADHVGWLSRMNSGFMSNSLRGHFEFACFHDYPRPRLAGFDYCSRAAQPFQLKSEDFFLGFGVEMDPNGIWLACPHWFLALLFAILPVLRFHVATRSRPGDRGGYCPRCGYDLRATPDRCPECGDVPTMMRPSKVTPSDPTLEERRYK